MIDVKPLWLWLYWTQSPPSGRCAPAHYSLCWPRQALVFHRNANHRYRSIPVRYLLELFIAGVLLCARLLMPLSRCRGRCCRGPLPPQSPIAVEHAIIISMASLIARPSVIANGVDLLRVLSKLIVCLLAGSDVFRFTSSRPTRSVIIWSLLKIESRLEPRALDNAYVATHASCQQTNLGRILLSSVSHRSFYDTVFISVS